MIRQSMAVLACVGLFGCGGPEAVSMLSLDGPIGAPLPPPQVSTMSGAALPVRMSAAAATYHDGKIVLTGGLVDSWPSDGNSSNCLNGIHQLDPDTGELTLVGRLAETIRGHALLSVPGGDLVSAMGYCGISAQEDTVFAIRDGGAQTLGTLPVGAFYPAAGVLSTADGGTALVFAGGYGSGPERDQIQALYVNTGNSRQLTAALPKPRPLAAGTASGNKLYVLGGSDTGTPPATTGSNPFSDEIVEVTMSPDTAVVVAQLPEPIAGGCAVTLGDGTIVMFGGAHYAGQTDGGLAFEPINSIITFDPATLRVEYSSVTLPQPLAGLACAATPDDRVFLFGGAGPAFVASDRVVQFESSAYLAKKAAEQPPIASDKLELNVGMGCSAAGGGPLVVLLLAFVLLRRRG